MSSKTLTPRERISKARINLLTDFPFFGILATHLIPKELTPEEVKMYGLTTMAVDEYGNMPYNPDFVAKIDEQELKGVVAHEVLHIALKHIERLGTRKMDIWNVAIDNADNKIVRDSGLKLPAKCIDIKEMYDKSSEETYDYLVKNAQKMKVTGNGKGQSQCNGQETIDGHVFGDQGKKGDKEGSGKDGKSQKGSPFAKPNQSKIDVARAVKEAYNYARQQGKVPAGMERLFSDILDPSMDWKDILRKYIVNTLPHDWSYTRPSKKSYSTGFYMPMVTKEFIEITVAVDSSGSIGDAEYIEFLSEIYHMVRQFESLRATLIVCDCAINTVVEIDETFDPACVHGRGYGGTSSIPVYNYIEQEKNDNIKLLVYFTDGYIDVPDKEPTFPTLWIVTGHGSVETVNKAKNSIVIQMPKQQKE